MKKLYTVTLKFQFPAWNNKDGISYYDVRAESKQQAIKFVRSQAFNDGHTGTGQGRITFSAVEQELEAEAA